MTAPVDRTPRRTPSARVLGVVLALVLVALGVVGIQHLAVEQGWTNGSSWLLRVLRDADDRTADPIDVAAGIALVILGLLLLAVAVLPGRRTHERSADADGAGIWVSPGATAAMAREAADRTDGVLHADVRPRRRGLDIALVAREGTPDVADAVRQSVADQLGDLAPSTVRVKVKETV